MAQNGKDLSPFISGRYRCTLAPLRYILFSFCETDKAGRHNTNFPRHVQVSRVVFIGNPDELPIIQRTFRGEMRRWFG
jgi:hypothetical protein